LLARSGRTLVVVEVKARRRGEPAEAVDQLELEAHVLRVQPRQACSPCLDFFLDLRLPLRAIVAGGVFQKRFLPGDPRARVARLGARSRDDPGRQPRS